MMKTTGSNLGIGAIVGIAVSIGALWAVAMNDCIKHCINETGED